MRHADPRQPSPQCAILREECTVLCSQCNTTSNTTLRTPFGMLCPGCFKLLHSIKPVQTKTKLPLAG